MNAGGALAVALVLSVACGNTRKVGGHPPVGVGGDAGAPGGGPASGSGGVAGAFDGECRVDADCAEGEGCEGGACVAENPPPSVVSVTPDDAALDAEPDTSVVIEFSEALNAETVTASSIRLLEGATVVPGELGYADGTVTFTPRAPLTLLASYTVSISTEITDETGVALASEHLSQFSIRDGAWHTIDAVSGKLHELSNTLPLSSTGHALLAWSGSAPADCPVFARWFLRGEAATPAETLGGGVPTECRGVTAGGNAAGVAAVTWLSPEPSSGGSYVQQYRDGAWQAGAELLPTDSNVYAGSIAVSPSGVATYLEHGFGIASWASDSSGKWPISSVLLSSHEVQNSRARAVFDDEGNGFAIWRGKDAITELERIDVSRFSKASGKWAAATELPGSVTEHKSPGYQRSAPALAFDNQGNALALWVDASADSKLVSSRFVPATGWAEPELVSAALVLPIAWDAPELVFDGQGFVTAWTTYDQTLYTARYDLEKGWSPPREHEEAASESATGWRLPRLASDGHGSLLLVLVQGAPAPGISHTLEYQRYAAGAWSAMKPIAGGTVVDDSAYTQALPLSMNGSGLAALTWFNSDADHEPLGIRLASFY